MGSIETIKHTFDKTVKIVQIMYTAVLTINVHICPFGICGLICSKFHVPSGELKHSYVCMYNVCANSYVVLSHLNIVNYLGRMLDTIVTSLFKRKTRLFLCSRKIFFCLAAFVVYLNNHVPYPVYLKWTRERELFGSQTIRGVDFFSPDLALKELTGSRLFRQLFLM